MTEPLLDIRQLSCERDERILFGQLCFQCRAGDILQLIGPNGSGKTTLLRCLAGVSREYQGDIFWRGAPLPGAAWQFARESLYLGHLPGIKKALTPIENLRWYQQTCDGTSTFSIEQALEKVGLAGYEETPCYQLSAGQHRRVALARLYLSSALCWILDEPFTAIDKQGVAALESLLEQHAARGGITLLTSHQDLSVASVRSVSLADYRVTATESRYDD